MALASNPVVQSYIVYSAILALKFLSLSFLTSFRRKTNGADVDIERVRKAQQNDLENIPVFWILGVFFVTTDPVAWWASMLFRIFTAARVIHTLVYAVLPVPQQPTRGFAWFTSFLINVYMGVQIVLYYSSAL